MAKYVTPTSVLDRVLRLRKRHLDAIDRVREGDEAYLIIIKDNFYNAIAVLCEHGYTKAQAEMTFTSITREKVGGGDVE